MMVKSEERKEKNEDLQRLGGNIELSGFSEFDVAEMVVIKKIIGNYVRKFTDSAKWIQKIKIRAKPIHEREKSTKYEVRVLINKDEGKPIAAKGEGRNIFMVIDDAFKKAEEMLFSE